MSRDTSIMAWNEIQAEGLVGRMQLETLQILAFNQHTFIDGAMTGQEVLRAGREMFGERSMRDNYQKRLGELRDMGMVDEGGPRPCSESGRMVLTWRFNGKRPQKVAKAVEREPRRIWVVVKQELWMTNYEVFEAREKAEERAAFLHQECVEFVEAGGTR